MFLTLVSGLTWFLILKLVTGKSENAKTRITVGIIAVQSWKVNNWDAVITSYNRVGKRNDIDRSVNEPPKSV